jgi:hypothetical protein
VYSAGGGQKLALPARMILHVVITAGRAISLHDCASTRGV